MPKAKPPQIDFSDLVSQDPTDIESGFCWFLSHHILRGNISLMGGNGKGWAVYTYFRALYSKQRQWVRMPKWREISEATGINPQVVKTYADELESKDFITFQKTETKKGFRYDTFKVIDNLFYLSKTELGQVESIRHPFEPELLAPTIKGYNRLQQTGDHTQIPQAVIEKHPPINLHITINQNIITQTGGNNKSFVIQVEEKGTNDLAGFLSSKSTVEEAFGTSIQQAIQDWKNTGVLPPKADETEE